MAFLAESYQLIMLKKADFQIKLDYGFIKE